MSFSKLAEIISGAKRKYPAFSKRLQEAEAFSRWEKAVGPIISKHARAVSVNQQVLRVEVDHSIWKSELHHRKQQILSILNQQSDPAAAKESFTIKDIYFVDAGKKKKGRMWKAPKRSY